jgi:hypothetical protein
MIEYIYRELLHPVKYGYENYDSEKLEKYINLLKEKIDEEEKKE